MNPVCIYWTYVLYLTLYTQGILWKVERDKVYAREGVQNGQMHSPYD